MHIDVITLFPDLMSQALSHSIPHRAQEKGALTLAYHNPRDFTNDPHGRVDDRPYGGGPGMVIAYAPLLATLQAIDKPLHAPLIYLSPQGQPIDQSLLTKTAKKQSHIVLLCGRYEGIDERFISQHVDAEWSMGDYVLSGGEFAALAIIDAVARLLPEVLGDPESAQQDSFSNGLLDYPHYTRPATIDGMSVPEVLQKGDHAAIERWRLKESLGKTWQKRPDLLKRRSLAELEQQLLKEYEADHE